ncbi:MAG: prephenate dehydratase [Burkholderiales bacterium]|nr:prephenate dehydratase [Burkholderiales bacterium]
MSSDPLKGLRKQIDDLDNELLRLFNERAKLAQSVGDIKGSTGVYRPEREAQVLRRLSESNPGPLPKKAIVGLFTEVISACRAQEEMLSVACLGPRGTFSEEALGKHFGGQVPRVMCASIDEVFRNVESGTVGFGVVPVENSTEGGVGRSMDLLLLTPLAVCGEVVLPVHQNLLSKVTRHETLRRIYSHAQSLAQCNLWLSQHLPNVERVPVASNAEAARRAADDADAAAIAGRAAAEHYGLSILASSIEDDPNNTTRFFVIGAQQVRPSGRDKTSFVMASQNKPGAIFDLLEPLARHQVSMTRLESRPSRTGLWEYVFFVDVEGHQEEANVDAALADIRARAGFLKILGSYPVAVA